MRRFALGPEIRELIEEIDVSESNYNKATNRYNSIANYIHNSEMTKYSPDIYIQGSFKLGTAIKPLTEDGSYDIDIVCNFTELNRLTQTQKKLKTELGNVIENYIDEKNMKNKPIESSRCWTINYVDESNFHVDILPSVPYLGTKNDEIAITDKRNQSYDKVSTDWEISNPKGFAEWFKDQSKFQEHKIEYLRKIQENKIYASIEEIPDYKIKTPLQRIVQLLKRHSEVMFEENLEYKPSSIIITTLAAKVYSKSISISQNFVELLIDIISSLQMGIDYDGGKPCVYNPVNTSEKLSEKWDKDEKYFILFLEWMEQIRTDFNIDNRDMTIKDRTFYIKRSLSKNNGDIGILLKDLYYHKKLKWTKIDLRDVKIKAYYSWKGFRFKEIKSGTALNKNGELRFEVITNNPNNYDIYWQITNTGDEAKSVNCLRGDFYESKIEQGKKVRTETTLYLGRHYVEAYLVKDNICYGKSSPFEVNITKGISFEWFKR